MPILILALSGRALAQAAKRVGADVMVSDFFGDMETRSLGRWHRLPGDLEDGIKSRELLDWVRASNQPIEGIAYGAGFEATPAVLGELAQIAPLIGNAPQIVAAVKDPFGFAELLRRLDLPHPEVAAAPRSGTCWLRKLRGGSGGTHIERATAASSAANDNHYFQAEAIGNPVSALFAANGRAARMLGLSAQWAAPTPAQPFRYGGCAGPLRLAPKLADSIERACHAITAATGLVGLNSLDMLATDDAFTILEINPRPGATLDVFDDPQSPSLWDCHVGGSRGELPARKAADMSSARAAMVVYTQETRYVPAKFKWNSYIADIPAPNSRISVGMPVCTVMAAGSTAGAARALAEERAARLLSRLPLLLQRSA
jgi:predicted ATP-grasp superfamily ATP-dependent carboligase